MGYTRAAFLVIIALVAASCTRSDKYAGLQRELVQFVAGKDARIGIAVIIDGTDTVAVNGNEAFPMLSVYKFPIAMALGDYCRTNRQSLSDSCVVTAADLHPDTYSPMLEKYAGCDTVMVHLIELLKYSLQKSDNNASDVLLNALTGPGYVMRYLNRLGIRGISIASTEAEMHLDPQLCYINNATPLAMATLLEKFDSGFNDPFSLGIKSLMESCETGTSRLAAQLITTNAVIGHKTGTGFTLPDGRLMAVNDVGYVHLPNGHRYSIAVFISGSRYDMQQTEALIAEISSIVFSAIQ